MSGHPRRRVDVRGLPAAARYVLALAVVGVVVAVVLATGPAPVAGWYDVVVRVGAVLLVVLGGAWCVARLVTAVRRRRRG